MKIKITLHAILGVFCVWLSFNSLIHIVKDNSAAQNAFNQNSVVEVIVTNTDKWVVEDSDGQDQIYYTKSVCYEYNGKEYETEWTFSNNDIFEISNKAYINPDNPLEFVCVETEKDNYFSSLIDDFLMLTVVPIIVGLMFIYSAIIRIVAIKKKCIVQATVCETERELFRGEDEDYYITNYWIQYNYNNTNYKVKRGGDRGFTPQKGDVFEFYIHPLRHSKILGKV